VSLAVDAKTTLLDLENPVIAANLFIVIVGSTAEVVL
jgi:hypothetical protein